MGMRVVGHERNALPSAVLEALRRYDSPTLANAIETFDVRSRATGFTRGEIRSIFDDLPPMVGYAVTGHIRSVAPSSQQYSRHSWWDVVLSVPPPRIVVLQDLDDPPGLGAFWGEVQANIHRALGCLGTVTNGAVRDLDAVRALPFHYFATKVSVSHAYVHLVDFGTPVTVGGLAVETGDLLHADRHGVLSVPPSIAAQLPDASDRILAKEKTIIDFCRSAGFSVGGLKELTS
jgi:4-hydroxy-4-methyl-2-oxoglutarate aldolase